MLCNELSLGIGFSHAGMTAEGDNSVLMQKVTKELLAAIQAGHITYPQIKKRDYNANVAADMIELVRLREIVLINDLQKTMKTKLSGGAHLFQVWMMEESDLIQAVSKAYGERICLEQMALVQESDSQVKNVIEKLTSLFAYGLVAQDLAFFLKKSILAPAQGQSVLDNHTRLIKEFAPYIPDTIKSLGIAEHMIFAPIAKDWKEYNAGDNRGEVYGAKL